MVVGGLAAVLQGAPLQTFDVDVVYSLDAENIQRILTFLDRVNAFFRIQPERRLKPGESHLAGGGHLNLTTDLVPLDLLGSIGRGLGYGDILPHSQAIRLGDGYEVQVLGLEKLIEVKEELGTEKDLAVLSLLRHTLAETRKRA